MKALSLSRPWPDAILYMGKRVENRRQKNGRMPPMCKYRGPLLLHSAQSFDGVGFHAFMRDVFHSVAYPKEHAIPPGVIFARCTVIGHIEPTGAHRVNPDPEHWDQSGRREPLDMRWHMAGSYALVLADVAATPLVPCKGALGLWTPPPDVLAQIGAEP